MSAIRQAWPAWVVAVVGVAAAVALVTDAVYRRVKHGPRMSAPAPREFPSYPAPEKSASKPEAGHVILIAVDGLRPDAITPERMPALCALIREGAYTAAGINVLPPCTLPNHTSMLTGLPAEGENGHGVTENWYVDDKTLPKGPTVFEAARARGLTAAFYYGKDKFLTLERPGALNWADRRDLLNGRSPGGLELAADLARDFRTAKWNLCMLTIPDCDNAGHTYGWMGPEYLAAARQADAAIGLVVGAVKESGEAGRTTILLTADHGGSGYGHFTDEPAHRTVPFLVFGPGVKAGGALGVEGGGPARPCVTDMAATAAKLLGLTLSPKLQGRYLSEAFEAKP